MTKRRAALILAIAIASRSFAGLGAGGLTEAKTKVTQSIEKQGDEYVEARDWLVQHPEALGLLGQGSWKEQWVKRICEAWIENRKLYEQVLGRFELVESRARRGVAVLTPGDSYVLKTFSMRHGEKLVPLMVECLWKTGRHWRRYKAWRVLGVVEYVKWVGDSSVVDPAIHVLATHSWEGGVTPDPGAEYPRMDPSHRACAEIVDQMAPYDPVELILQFGDESTVAKLTGVMDNPETSEALKQVLKKTIELLRHRLDAKKQGLGVAEVGLFDIYVEFGDRTTLENMRRMWGERGGSHGPKVRKAMTELEKRLEREQQLDEAK